MTMKYCHIKVEMKWLSTNKLHIKILLILIALSTVIRFLHIFKTLKKYKLELIYSSAVTFNLVMASIQGQENESWPTDITFSRLLVCLACT
jgi:hypothetical protein